jgi:hypothetical protein
MGGTLEEAARVAVTIRATTNLGERSTEIVQFVNNHPEAVRAGDVATPKEPGPISHGFSRPTQHYSPRLRQGAHRIPSGVLLH